jgi:hypothetical protein
MFMLIFMTAPLSSFAQSSEGVGANEPSLAQVNEGVAFGLCVAAIFLCLFALEALRGRLGKEIYANAATWGIFLILTAAGHVRSPNDPSIYITVGAAMQLLAFTILIVPAGTYPRFPPEFGMLVLLTLMIRIWATVFYQGYLPNDKTGDGCIQLIEAVTLLIVVWGLIRETRAMPSSFPCGEIARTIVTFVICAAAGVTCFGDLDYTPETGIRADEAYATAMYMELAAWGFMLRFALTGSCAKNPTWLLPAFIQAISRTYFWYSSIAATQVEDPHRLQRYFPYMIAFVHLGATILIGLVAMSSNVDISKAHPLMEQEEKSPV